MVILFEISTMMEDQAVMDKQQQFILAPLLMVIGILFDEQITYLFMREQYQKQMVVQ